MKNILGILFLSLLLSGNANAKEVLFASDDFIIIKDRFFTYGNDKIAKEHCYRKNKHFIRLSMNGRVSNKPADYTRYYCVKDGKDFISKIEKFNKTLPKNFYNINRDRPLKKEFIFSSNAPDIKVADVSNTQVEYLSGQKTTNSSDAQSLTLSSQKTTNSSNSQSLTLSTDDKIAQSKQICRDLGFKVNSEKFADCALKMMSIQFEATNKVASGSGTKQEIIVKHKQDYDIFDAMIDMSNALSGSSNNSNSSSSGSSGTRCVMQKTHAWGHTVMNCN